MRAASASSNEAFRAELEAIKAMSLGLGEPIGLAADGPARKSGTAKLGAKGAVNAAAAQAALKTWLANQSRSTSASGRSMAGTTAVDDSEANKSTTSDSCTHEASAATPAAAQPASRPASAKSLYAKGLLLPGEDPAEFEQFVAGFCADLAAVGVVQITFATRAAELSWKLRRLPAMEGAILSSLRQASGEQDFGIGGMGDVLHQLVGKDEEGILKRLQQYETRIERSITRCLREVKVLQMTKLKEAGFMGKGAVGSFGSGTSAVGWASAHQDRQAVRDMSSGVTEGMAVDTSGGRESCGGLKPTLRDEESAGAVGWFGMGSEGSFCSGTVGSFGIAPHAHGQPSVGACEGASAVEAPSPARGPSAARQDDGFAGVRLGLGSFGKDAMTEDAVGSF